MTIALGLVGNDGLVLGADMQRTIGGYTKTFDGKVPLILYNEHRIAISIAGAGTENYIETARRVLLDDFPEQLEKHQSMPLQDRIPYILKERFLMFFDDHMARWAYFPERERPTVELLIGVTGKGLYPQLYHCDGTAFHKTYRKAIGSGVIMADQLLLQYALHEKTIQNLSTIAIYILQRVKKGVDGCGGSTSLVALRKGFDFAITDHNQIVKMESDFDELDKSLDESTVKSICEKPYVPTWHTEYKKKPEERKQK